MRWRIFVFGLCLGFSPFLLSQVLVYQDRFGGFEISPYERLTLASLSPNDEFRAVMVELPGALDRNFELRLQQQGENTITISRSPDEGRPAGSERIVWLKDSSKFALFGRHFIDKNIPENFKSETGEVLYLIYDVQSKHLYCHLTNPTKYSCLPLAAEQYKRFREFF